MEPTPDDRGPPKGPRSEVRRSITPQVMSFYPRFEAAKRLLRLPSSLTAQNAHDAAQPGGVMDILKSITPRKQRGKMRTNLVKVLRLSEAAVSQCPLWFEVGGH